MSGPNRVSAPNHRWPSILRPMGITLAIAALAFAAATFAAERLQFRGTDDRATSAIEAARPGYERWIAPLWAPRSHREEVTLFAVQALLGAAVLGWALGRSRVTPREPEREAHLPALNSAETADERH